MVGDEVKPVEKHNRRGRRGTRREDHQLRPFLCNHLIDVHGPVHTSLFFASLWFVIYSAFSAVSAVIFSLGGMATFWSASLALTTRRARPFPLFGPHPTGWHARRHSFATDSQPCGRLRISSVFVESRATRSGLRVSLSTNRDTSDQKRLHIPPAVHRKTRKQRHSEDLSPAWKMLCPCSGLCFLVTRGVWTFPSPLT